MSDHPETDSVNVDSFKCESCGAYVRYKPGTINLHCDYCGSDTPIDIKFATQIKELDYNSWLKANEQLESESFKVVRCHHCDAQSTFDEKQKSMQCPYCGTAIIESDVHYERLIKPSYLLPFVVSEGEVQDCVSKWIRKLWFAPTKLKKQAVYSNHLKAVFIPSWTYDAHTSATYFGQRGDDYTVTVGSGKNRRTVTRTRWRHVSGKVSRIFDDVMVQASRLIPEKVMAKLQNWDKQSYVEYDKRFLSGLQTEKYSVTFTEGMEQARAIMESIIRNDICRDIGGDHQRITTCDIKFNNIKFKLVLLPLFISSYTFNHKLYHFYVNGRTGQIDGERPYSAWKIFFAVLAGLIALGGFVYFIMQN